MGRSRSSSSSETGSRSRSPRCQRGKDWFRFKTPLKTGTTWKPAHDGLTPADVGGLTRISVNKADGSGCANHIVGGVGFVAGGIGGGMAGAAFGPAVVPAALAGGFGGRAVAMGHLGYNYYIEMHSDAVGDFYFEDETGDTYSLAVFLTCRNHDVCYNSAAPAIVGVSWRSARPREYRLGRDRPRR